MVIVNRSDMFRCLGLKHTFASCHISITISSLTKMETLTSMVVLNLKFDFLGLASVLIKIVKIEFLESIAMLHECVTEVLT